MAARNVNKSKKRNITQQNLAATPINPSGGPLTKNTRKRPFLLEVLFNALKLLLFALIVMGFGVLGLVYGVGKAYVDSTPLLEVSQLTRSDRTSYLYDMYGNEITNLTSMEYRDWADFNEIPDILKNAFVSSKISGWLHWAKRRSHKVDASAVDPKFLIVWARASRSISRCSLKRSPKEETNIL